MPLSKSAKIGIGWTVCTIGGIYAFYLSKESVIKRRYEHMKIRQRILNSNPSDYPEIPQKYSNEN